MKVIHTKTQEQFNKVLEIFEKKGWVWVDWDEPTKGKEYWEIYKKETCLIYKDKFEYSSLEYYKEEGYTIISFEDLLKEEGIKETNETNEIKPGDRDDNYIVVYHPIIGSKKIPEKPLQMYTEQEEKDLLELLLKIK